MGVETPAEACAALAILMAGADRIGTMEESRFIYDEVATLPAFAGLDRPAFARLMEETTDWVWSTFPNEGGRVTVEGVSVLIGQICTALPRAMRGDALRAAMGLARADGMSPDEKLLLTQLCDGLEVDPASLAGPESSA